MIPGGKGKLSSGGLYFYIPPDETIFITEKSSS